MRWGVAAGLPATPVPGRLLPGERVEPRQACGLWLNLHSAFVVKCSEFVSNTAAAEIGSVASRSRDLKIYADATVSYLCLHEGLAAGEQGLRLR